MAKSGLRKANPVILAKQLVSEAKTTRVVAGRNSIQQVIAELGKATSQEGGGVVKDASGFMVSGELAAFLIKDPEALTILTDLYDTFSNEPEWRNSLKSGKDILKHPCLTLLGATNEDHFKGAVGDKDIKGGFIARTSIIYETQRRVINDLMDRPKITPSIKDLVAYLKEVSKLKGEFSICEKAKQHYRVWYKEISEKPHQDHTGTIERLGDTVLKVAMLISLSEGTNLEIGLDNIEEAIFRCVETLGGLSMVTMGAGRSEFGVATALVLKELINSGGYFSTKKKILAKYWGEFDSLVLDRVAETLQQSGAIDIDKEGKVTVYKLTKRAIETYVNFKKEIN